MKRDQTEIFQNTNGNNTRVKAFFMGRLCEFLSFAITGKIYSG